MMFIVLFLFSCLGTYCFLYKHIIDAIEFTCIDYDDLPPESAQIYKPEPIVVVKYEDKYKTELQLIPNEIIINQSQIDDRLDVLLKQSIGEITDKINRELVSYEWELIKATEYREQRSHFINDKMEQMKSELWARILDKESITELAETQLIQERLANLKYSFVMEHTPIGNVIMYYNSAREAFEYYSDNVVPYRYLDTVCRKYVIMNLCVPLYVDISKELKEFQTKEPDQKKQMPNVFVKLKNYKKTVNKPSMKIMLKARTNKYLYQGRMSNFSFMNKVESKSESLSFADYKRMLSK
jgi:hypothetical protein